MSRTYQEMNADETNKFQVVLAHWRAARLAKWLAAEACKKLAAEVDAIAALGAELASPGDAISYDSRQGAKSIFAADGISWNALVNERNSCATFATAEQVAGIAGYQLALGNDFAI